jgi:hypothetical protein
MQDFRFSTTPKLERLLAEMELDGIRAIFEMLDVGVAPSAPNEGQVAPPSVEGAASAPPAPDQSVSS